MASYCHSIFVKALILVSLCFPSIKAALQDSLVTNLPGFNGKFPSNHYSGYISIGDNNAKEMFYYYVESEKNPPKDPIVLWLNGGPGCSSMGGFVYEHGPFKFDTSGVITSRASTKKGDLSAKLHLNPNSWSKVSNIIYLDSPVGTGFSFSWNISDYKTGDLRSVSDIRIFLLQWFEKFPERLSNQFYIAGESYAGIIIPTLAYEIMKGVNSGSRPIINLKGYMIGNGVTDKNFDRNAIVPFAHGMGLLSDDLYQGIIDECQGRYFYSDSCSRNCESKLDKFQDAIRNMNPYNIMEPCYEVDYDHDNGCYNCLDDYQLNKKLSRSFGNFRLENSHSPVKTRIFANSDRLKSEKNLESSHVVNNINILCKDDMGPSLWLNHEAVRKAIHAAQERVTGTWELCTNRLTYHREVESTIKYHKKLITMGLRVLIYSGDHDMVVPYTGSEAWTRSLGYKIIDEWRPWISNAQVAGFIQGYDNNFTFLTIKGAGHMVPEDKPRETLHFYSRWLARETI